MARKKDDRGAKFFWTLDTEGLLTILLTPHGYGHLKQGWGVLDDLGENLDTVTTIKIKLLKKKEVKEWSEKVKRIKGMD